MIGSPNHDERLRDLHERHFHEVLAYCARRVGLSEAEDVVADVFVMAWRKIDEIEPDTARALLYSIARGLLANRWRALRRRQRLAGKVAGLAVRTTSSADEQVVRRSEDREVGAALESLRPTDREALMLAAWEGLTNPQIAASLGISVSAAEQRVHRAKRRLATALERAPSNSSPRAAEQRGGR